MVNSENMDIFSNQLILFYYSAPQCSLKHCTSYSNSVCLSVRLFVRLSVCHTPVLCQNVARCSLLSANKICLVLKKPKNIPQKPPLKSWLKVTHPLRKQRGLTRSSASTVRDRKRSSIIVNKKLTRAFQRAVNQGSTPPLTSSKWGSRT